MHTNVCVAPTNQLVTFFVDDQQFGIAINKVQDILVPERIAPIPLAPAQVQGAINVRGKIVTVIDVRSRLNLEKRSNATAGIALTVEHNAALYTLLVDKVGDVVEVPELAKVDSTAIADRQWRDIADGIVKLDDSVIVVMDVDRFLALS
ncbi:MAG: chemotaxis protein CheW [Rhodospirillales bacterium]|nr:chemotaxis protein CheW [Rhodospirillales bacterium]